MLFEEDPTGPLLRLAGEDFSDPACQLRNGCDPIEGMRCARYSGMEDPPAPYYIGKVICHGQRPMSQGEQAQAKLFGKTADTVCDIEIIVARDF